MTPLLEAKNLVKVYELGSEKIYALNKVSLTVAKGEFVAVMGPSGSGKSTLMHLIGLLDRPDEGEILLDGKDTLNLSDDDLTALRRDELGFIFQTFELIPTLSARENIMLPAEVAGTQSQALGIETRLEHKPSELSGGQRQRVAIARALINDPAVILADEPTGNLDSKTGEEVLTLLQEGVREQNWTVIMVTHDEHAATYADRVVRLKDGVIHEISQNSATQAEVSS